ncbi:MAG: cobalamin-binding protein [Chloroflexi bacterium]|nr:cobalamin-binding protein [Chloroflexota bacterium]
MKRYTLLLLILLTVLAACGAPTATVAPTAAPTAVPPTTTAVPAPTAAPTVAPTATPVPPTPTPAPFPLTITDGAGRKVTIAKEPKRIVSLAPSTTEIAFAIGQGAKVVGVDDFSDYPAEVKNLPKVGGFKPNFEQIVAKEPDLVLAAGGILAPDSLKQLEDLKLTVVEIGAVTTTMDSIMADITLAGRVTGAPDKAKTLTDSMRKRLDDLTNKGKTLSAVNNPLVYWELDATDPNKPFTVGPGNFVNDIIALSGGRNAFAKATLPFAQISTEQVVAANPNIIILSDAAYGVTAESVKARKGWAAIDAVKKNRVFPIDDNLVSRPGPRVLDGLEAAMKLIHAGVYK